MVDIIFINPNNSNNKNNHRHNNNKIFIKSKAHSPNMCIQLNNSLNNNKK